MEKAPEINKKEISSEEIRSRIAQIDAAIIASINGLNKVPAENELGTSIDDDGLEGEANEIAYGLRQNEIEELRREKAELEKMLEEILGKAA